MYSECNSCVKNWLVKILQKCTYEDYVKPHLHLPKAPSQPVASNKTSERQGEEEALYISNQKHQSVRTR